MILANIAVTVEPAFEPVSLSQVWNHLRLTPEGSPASTSLDTQLAKDIKAARLTVEHSARISLVERTLRLSVDSFPETGKGITIFRPPLIYVLSVEYYDADNVLQTVAASNWYVTDEDVPRLMFVASFSSPTTYARPDAVRVVYKSGYAGVGSPPSTQEDAAASVPADLKNAVLLAVEVLQGNTSPADRDALNNAIEAICRWYRVQIL